MDYGWDDLVALGPAFNTLALRLSFEKFSRHLYESSTNLNPFSAPIRFSFFFFRRMDALRVGQSTNNKTTSAFHHRCRASPLGLSPLSIHSVVLKNAKPSKGSKEETGVLKPVSIHPQAPDIWIHYSRI